MKAAVGMAPPTPEPELPRTLPQQLLQQIDEATTLTWRQRAIGFGCSFGGGLLLAFMVRQVACHPRAAPLQAAPLVRPLTPAPSPPPKNHHPRKPPQSFISLSTFNLTGFAIMYSLGSIMTIVSMCFLVGPQKQIKNMFENHRLLATIVYLLAIVATLAIAFSVSGILGVVGCIVCVVVQFLAAAWYGLTYIPGGQDCLKGLVVRS